MEERQQTRPELAPGRRRLVGAVITLLVVALVPLAAGARIDRPATAAERDLVRAAIAANDDPMQPATLSARMFHAVTLPDDAGARLDADPGGLVAQARLAMVLGLATTSMLLYLLLGMARGGATALLACAVLAGLPAVAETGALLSPDPFAVSFGLLGTLLLATFVQAVGLARPEGRSARVALLLAIGAAAGAAYGVAGSASTRAIPHLLVPGGVLVLVTVINLVPWARTLLGAPVAGAQPLSPMVLWSWFGMALALPLGAVAVLQVFAARGIIADPSAGPAASSLSGGGVVGALFTVLAVAGGVRLLFEAGIRLGRSRLVDGVSVLLLHVAVLLMQHHLTPHVGALLPATVAFAVLVAEGAMTTLLLVLGWLVVRARRRQQQAAPG